MNVDFDNLRLQACHSFNRLVGLLNDHHDKDFDRVHICASDLTKEVDELRQLIGTIALCESEIGGFKSVMPAKGLDEFNPE